MIKTAKKLVVILLFCTLLTQAAGIAGCASNETKTPGDNSADLRQSDSAPAETEFVMNPLLPEKDYGGYEFRILTTDERGSIRFPIEIYAENLNGEILNDAVYRRNLIVEEKFNVKIVQQCEDAKNYVTNFKNSVLAGDDSYDCIVSSFDQLLNICTDYCLRIDTLGYINIENGWWDTNVIKSTALANKMYLLNGDINIIDDTATWCMYFNKRIADEYHLPDLYELVKSGKWTVDELDRLCKDVARDLNGDNILDTSDQWGMLSSSNAMLEFVWSSGGMLGTLSKDGDLTPTIDTVKNIDALERALRMALARDTVLLAEKNGASDPMGMQKIIFNDGRALFYQAPLTMSYNDFRDMEDEFGIIPYPKADLTQSSYICTPQEWTATAFAVPKTAPDPDRTGIILDAMSSAASVTITPAFYDTALKRKYTRDDDSSEMLDLIFDSRTFDLIYAMNLGNIRNSLKQLMLGETNVIASTIASIKPAIQKALEERMTE